MGEPVLHSVPVTVLDEAAAALRECAEDLECWVEQHYPPEARKYPSEERRYQRDMEPVRRARAILEQLPARPADQGAGD